MNIQQREIKMKVQFSFPLLILLFLVCAFGAPALSPSPQRAKSKRIDPGLMAKAKAGSANRRAKVKM